MNPKDITELLHRWQNGNNTAGDELAQVVYSELKKISRSCLRKENNHHLMQTTELVNQAYIRLISQENPRWEDRTHFFGVFAKLIRQTLVDEFRLNNAIKRGSNNRAITLEDDDSFTDGKNIDLLALDEALEMLKTVFPRRAAIVDLRYFLGLTINETAKLLKVSPNTIKRDWDLARKWIKYYLKDD